MFRNLAAMFWLLVVTVVLCCGIYPVALWAVGQTLLRDQANGSLIYDKDNKPVGSKLIAQQFTNDAYFQPRPSSTSPKPYKADASGGSNWGANNYSLRDRVAQTLGPIVKYKTGPNAGQLVAPDVVAWFREKKDVVATWATAHSGPAQNWVKADDETKAATQGFVKAWFEAHPAELEAWKKENPDKSDPAPEDLAVPFFVSFAKEKPATWLTIVDDADKKKTVALVGPDAADPADIAAVFFDLWRQEHASIELVPVPADLVMSSGSGLDPHITLDGALYQLDRVAGKWAELKKRDEKTVRGEIETLVRAHASAPMAGLAGVPLVNVLEVNLAIRDKYGAP
jgi:potassium-transporting ATPase KdpC subunit